jgi:hypothetical protein
MIQKVLNIPHCDEAMSWTSKSIDSSLTLKQRFLLRLHISMCGACKKYHAQMGVLHSVMNAIFKSEGTFNQLLDIKLPEETKERMKKEIESHGD